MSVRVEEGSDAPTDAQAAVAWPWLRGGLAIALCFHLLGNALIAGERWSLAGGVVAALVLAVPGRRWPLAVLAVFTVGLYWHEAPIVGNHLILLAAVTTGVAIEAYVRRSGAAPLAAARAAVLVFYAFASFAKLNEGFFDPDASCAPFYLSEGTRSLHLPDPVSWAGVPWASIVLTVVIEASVPVLLLVQRTRTWGVVVALVFHAAIALDRTHQFFDFSALLSVVFVTFLPAAVLSGSARSLGRFFQGRVLRLVAPAAAVLAGVVSATAADRFDRRLALDVGWAAWQVLALVVGIALGAALLSSRGAAPAFVALRPRAALLIVALVAVNGVLPYLEVKTGGGWNMYANLRIVDGDSNHLVVRASLPITSPQDDLVTIVSTDDPALGVYAGRQFLLPVRSLRAYLQERPGGVDAVLDVGGERVVLRAGEPIPERLGPPVPEWVRRLFVLRSVSTNEVVPCQDAYFAAT